jgi:NAD-dependent dihydropyrimidine dehydrogenase PreA subunit
MPEVKIDLEKCDGDGICVDVCPVAVFELKEEGGNTKSYVVNQDECLVCMACVVQCPQNAIEVNE